MRADLDDVHCDSLSGTELASPALSSPPSPRSEARTQRALRAGALLVGLLVGGAWLAELRREPEPAASGALHVDGRSLSYSEGFAARAGIRTTEVKEASFLPVVSGVGKAAFDPEAVAAVDAQALGTVRKVVKYEGEEVRQGDVLAEIGSPGLARIEAASFLRARSAGPSASQVLGVSLVRSPLAGTVVERRVVTGQSVKGERVVFVVANLDRLLLDVEVDAREARALRAGDRVELEPGAAASPIRGEVAQVSEGESSDLNSGRPLRVRVGVDNRARRLRPGQAVSAKIFASTGARALVIPTRAVAWIAGRPAVFVESGHNSLHLASVTLGGGNGELTEVAAGLSAGQRIVSEGVGVLKDESFL